MPPRPLQYRVEILAERFVRQVCADVDQFHVLKTPCPRKLAIMQSPPRRRTLGFTAV
jgi:hypothetical protein